MRAAFKFSTHLNFSSNCCILLHLFCYTFFVTPFFVTPFLLNLLVPTAGCISCCILLHLGPTPCWGPSLLLCYICSTISTIYMMSKLYSCLQNVNVHALCDVCLTFVFKWKMILVYFILSLKLRKLVQNWPKPTFVTKINWHGLKNLS